MLNELDIIQVIRKRLVLIIVLTFTLFVSSQFVVMATVSTRGADIGDIRREQEEIRLENEQLRADINSAKTMEQILQDINERFDMHEAYVHVIQND